MYTIVRKISERLGLAVAGSRRGSRGMRGAEEISGSEGEAGADLGREGDADGGAGAEEITEGAGGDAQLVEAGDGLRLRAGGIQAERGGIREVVDGRGKRCEIRDVIRAGIVAVEKVEEFDEGRSREALAKFERTANAHVNLNVRRAAKLIHGGLHAIDHGAVIERITDSVYVNGSRDGEWARALELRERADFESTGRVKNSRDNEPMAHIFARRAVIAFGKRVEWIANAIHIIEKFAENASPGFRAAESVVDDQVRPPRNVSLQMNGKRVVARAIVASKHGQIRNSVHLVSLIVRI